MYNWVMDKLQLIEKFKSAKAGAAVEILFVGAAAGLSGTYTFKGTRTGRGRNGSTIVDLLKPDGTLLGKVPNPSPSDPDHLSDFGSGVSHLVGTVKIGDEEASGDVSAAELSLLPKDALRASQLTEGLRPLIGQKGVTLHMQSRDATLHGTFTLLSCEASKGRVPQLHLRLRRDSDGSEVDFYTYRHAQFMVDVAV
jgi:hypothetical protein